MKTHFAYVERATESDPMDYWSSTICGIEYTEIPLTDSEKEVTCKRCLKRVEKLKPIEQDLPPIY